MREVKELKPSDILFLVFLPYILLGYVALCLLYAPYELIKERLSLAFPRWTSHRLGVDFRSGNVKVPILLKTF